MSQAAERGGELDLQISLLPEHEITEFLKVAAEIGTRLQFDIAREPEVTDLQRDIQPEEILSEIERRQPE